MKIDLQFFAVFCFFFLAVAATFSVTHEVSENQKIFCESQCMPQVACSNGVCTIDLNLEEINSTNACEILCLT